MSSALIQQGLAALRGGDVAAARRVFESALAEGESGQVLEGLGEALYLGREYVAAVAHYERAHVAYRRERQIMAAGRAARTVAWITGNVLGDWAVRSGWLARARALLEEAGVDRPEHGWVLIIKAFYEPDARVREAQLREAIAVGRRSGDPDIEFLALAYLGSLYVPSWPRSTRSSVGCSGRASWSTTCPGPTSGYGRRPSACATATWWRRSAVPTMAAF